MQQNQSNQIENRVPNLSVVRAILTFIGFVAIVACLAFGLQLASGIAFGIALSSGGDTILHSDPNADHTILVHAVSDDCGATCDCSTRLDITFGQKTKKGIYRVPDACDVEIKWLDQYRFEVIAKWGETIVLDARDFDNEQ
jgi:hypothetical protein